MTMDLSNLSSNWKQLQRSLDQDKKEKSRARLKHDGLPRPSQPLKRKAVEELPRRSKTVTQTGVNARRKSQDPGHIVKTFSAREPRKMESTISLPVSATTPSNGSSLQQHTSTKDLPAQVTNNPPKPSPQAKKYIALDCEMVGTTSLTPFSIPQRSATPSEYSLLARVSLISYELETLYDAYVLPPPDVHISDYRTAWSGITPWHLHPSNPTTAPKPFELVQKEVAALLDGRILIGHAVRNDLAVLGLSHPKRTTRDTARHLPFRALAAAPGKDGGTGKGKMPALKRLAKEILGLDIQNDVRGGHSSVEDARAAMALFRREKVGFENEAARTFGRVDAKARQAMARSGVADGGEDGDEGEDGPKKRRKKKKNKGRRGV